MLARLYSESRSGVNDLIARIRRYENLETQLEMSEFEKNQTHSDIFVYSTLFAAMIPPSIAFQLTPFFSKLMGIPMGASIFASPVIPLVIAILLLCIYIGQRIVLRRLKFGYLIFLALMTFIGSYGGWTLYLLKLKIAADPSFLR
jgi:hypothetical protein